MSESSETDARKLSRLERLASTLGDSIVELGAIAGIGFVATTNIPEASLQILVGAITSIALGKRWMAK